MDFIDLHGASGNSYRFRRWPESGVHPPIAGNFAVIEPASRELLAVGVVNDLSRPPPGLPASVTGAYLFTRLNISRRVREAEHADLALAYPDIAPAAPAAVGRAA